MLVVERHYFDARSCPSSFFRDFGVLDEAKINPKALTTLRLPEKG